MKIHAACMTQNELSDLIPNVQAVLPYVDSMTIIDGGSEDLTIPYMRNWARTEPKLRFYIDPWEDDFPKQRNKYVAKVKEIAQDGDWLITFDPDEYYLPNTLANLKNMAAEAEAQNSNLIGLQCITQSARGQEIVHENLDDYWKHLVIKWHPDFHYTGFKCHEGKAGFPHRIMNTAHQYYHRKQEDIIWIRGMRNSFIAGGGDNIGDQNPLWGKAKDIILRVSGQTTWHGFYKYLLAGNIHQELKDFIIATRNEGTPKAGPECWRKDDWPGSSEWREWYKSYFRFLHPEEEPDHLKSEYLP